MTTEELLKPRYKVIEKYPQSYFTDPVKNKVQVGDIFMKYIEQDTVWRHFNKGQFTDITVHFIEQFPAIFKKLEWWEERSEEDFPKYVKHGANGLVREVLNYNDRIEVLTFVGGRTRRIKKEWIPTTKEEFDNQQNQTIKHEKFNQ